MANSIPLVITVSADGTIQAAANINNVANAAKKTGEVADFVKSKLAGAFAVGTIVAAGRAALSYSADLQDMADQFGVTASQAEGFIRQIRNVGGSSEKASSILQKLQAYQEKIGNTQSISDFIASVAESYQRTNDFGQILEIVGAKNAAVFRAALVDMSNGLEQFNNDTINRTSALTDFYSEQWEKLKDASKLGWSSVLVDAGTFGVAFSKGWAELIKTLSPTKAGSAFAQLYKDQQKLIDEVEKRRIESDKAVIDARRKEEDQQLYDYWQKTMLRNVSKPGDMSFMGPLSNGYTYTNPAFVGPMQQPEKANRVGSDYQLAPFMSALSSAAVVALQKYKEGGSNSIEKQTLLEQKRQSRWIQETAENTRNAGVSLEEVTF